MVDSHLDLQLQCPSNCSSTSGKPSAEILSNSIATLKSSVLHPPCPTPSILSAVMAAALDKRIGFIGSGQMAEALARGLVERKMVTPDQLSCSDPSPARKDLFKSFGATPFESNVDVSVGVSAGVEEGLGVAE